ncbi:hypothetical protein HMPREF1292_00915 [Corynebacterium sp. KPL1995]|nr:hypothetical protein HMPREF1292_00915 [Corynebacterium sp. KPL1995]ERS72925.1 hypothetical protein HMPREF1290_00918 [Corynebacterium sp. KPL1989]
MISMGKLILLALIILAAVLVWKAFGPASWNQNRQMKTAERPAIKGPDDDEEFLWNIEKNRFKERRRQEQERQQRHEHQQRQPRSQGEAKGASRTNDAPDTNPPGDTTPSGDATGSDPTKDSHYPNNKKNDAKPDDQ